MAQEPETRTTAGRLSKIVRWVILGAAALALSYLMWATGAGWLWLALVLVGGLAAVRETRLVRKVGLFWLVLTVFLIVTALIAALTLLGPAISRALYPNL
jgi:hypothetical protein